MVEIDYAFFIKLFDEIRDNYHQVIEREKTKVKALELTEAIKYKVTFFKTF